MGDDRTRDIPVGAGVRTIHRDCDYLGDSMSGLACERTLERLVGMLTERGDDALLTPQQGAELMGLLHRDEPHRISRETFDKARMVFVESWCDDYKSQGDALLDFAKALGIEVEE